MKKVQSDIIKAITEFVFLDMAPENADIIFIPGGSNSAPAILAADLYNKGFAPLLLPSGKGPYGIGHFSGDKTKGSFSTECDFYCSIFASAGIPFSAILREDKAEYTKENAALSKVVCDREGLKIKKALLACKSYHSRRAYTYYSIYFPEAEIIPVSVDIPARGKNDWFSTDKGIERICGEVDRMANQFIDFLKDGK